MSYIEEIIEYNESFVQNKQYEQYEGTKYPAKKIAVLSCMDTRLTELLPAALGFKNGDLIIIKNAGALISHPFGSVMRSILVSIYELGVEEVIVIGHYDCGVQGLDSSKLIEKMIKRNVPKEKIDEIHYCGIDIDKWLKGFDSIQSSVLETVDIIRKHPFIPSDIEINGFIIDPETGKLGRI